MSSDEIFNMAKKQFHLDDNKSAAKLIDVIMDKEKADILLTSTAIETPTELTTEEAVRLIVKGNLTKRNYIDIRNNSLQHHVHLYPTYKKVIRE